MSKKKKNKPAGHCDCLGPHCVFFPQTPSQILDEQIIDGIKHRKVVRCCRCDGVAITGWGSDEKKCNLFEKI